MIETTPDRLRDNGPAPAVAEVPGGSAQRGATDAQESPVAAEVPGCSLPQGNLLGRLACSVIHWSNATVSFITTVAAVIAGYYALQTRRVATANQELAVAAREDRLTAARPVIILELPGSPHVKEFAVRIKNAGNGLALGIEVRAERSPLRHRWAAVPAQPLALGAGDSIDLTSTLKIDTPFQDEADSFRWPRDAEDAAVESEARRLGRQLYQSIAAAIRGPSAPPPEGGLRAVYDRLEQRKGLYELRLGGELTDRAHADQIPPWWLRATYEDLYEGQWEMRAPIEVTQEAEGVLPRVRLGATKVGPASPAKMPPRSRTSFLRRRREALRRWWDHLGHDLRNPR